MDINKNMNMNMIRTHSIISEDTRETKASLYPLYMYTDGVMDGKSDTLARFIAIFSDYISDNMMGGINQFNGHLGSMYSDINHIELNNIVNDLVGYNEEYYKYYVTHISISNNEYGSSYDLRYNQGFDDGVYLMWAMMIDYMENDEFFSKYIGSMGNILNPSITTDQFIDTKIKEMGDLI